MWHSGGRRQLEGFIPQSRCLPWERPGTQQCIHVKRYRLFAKCIYKGLRAHCDMCVPEFGCLFAYIWVRLLYLSSILHFFLFGAGFQSINAPFFFFLAIPCSTTTLCAAVRSVHCPAGPQSKVGIQYPGHTSIFRSFTKRFSIQGLCFQMYSPWRVYPKRSDVKQLKNQW